MIKISTFRSELHNKDLLDNEKKSFIRNIEENLKEELVFSPLEDYDCDLKLIFIESGGSEGMFLSSFDKLMPPHYLLTSGSDNSLAASLEILTYLNNNSLNGEVIHGDASYIANRISVLSRIERAKRILSSSRLGVIGKPSDWLISSIPDYDRVKEMFGISLIDISLDEIEKRYGLCKPKKSFLKEFDYSVNDLERSEGIYDSIKEVVDKYQLDGYTIRCFDLLNSIHGTGCLSLAKSNESGIIATCEGDVAAMITMKIIKALTDSPSFQANPSRIDTSNNTVLFAHCTIPLDMVEKIKIETHFESGIGCAVRGKLREEDVTIFRISADLKRYYIEEGTIISNPEESNLCRTQILVKMNGSVSELLKNPCGNHHMVFYGKHKKLIEEFLKTIYE